MRAFVASLCAASSTQVDPATVVEIGKEIYEAIKDNQPVIDTTVDWAGAVPNGVTDWTQLEHWQGPAQSDGYYIEFKNGLGEELTKFAWRFVWKYGGDMNGVGKYVTQAGIDIDSSYAYLSENLDVEVKSLKPVNYGTSGAPVGGVDIQVSVSSHGLFEKTTKVCTMTLKGDGTSALGTCEHGTFELSQPSNDPPTIDPSVIAEIGKVFFWAIHNNEDNLNNTVDWAGAVPKGVTEWTQLENWKGPSRYGSFQVLWQGLFWVTLADFEWSFVWKWGGDMDGVGQYVTEAGIEIDAESASGIYGQNLDVKVQALNPVNYGTEDEPVGGVDIQVSVRDSGVLSSAMRTCTLTVKGDGDYQLGDCDTDTFVRPPPPHVALVV